METIARGDCIIGGDWKVGPLLTLSDGRTFIAWEVRPETVKKYTGLIDHFGRAIFEGDTLAYYNPKERCLGTLRAPVVFRDSRFCIERGTPPRYLALVHANCKYLEVVD